MGACMPCLFGSADDYEETDPEERRQQQAEAAEKRIKQEESRGIKDPEGLKRRQQQKDEADKQAEALQQQGAGENQLAWQVG
ncbi:small VCP/p97-interacting protein-like [Asterias rubens]|uniref:small VCP/p97-interacting protein-like n=1 Tax=Asterias rubens TaxID=7604 RepID=UPI001455D1EC|nr:small VCP/p97-interacting protein-like [Asterias rubens]